MHHCEKTSDVGCIFCKDNSGRSSGSDNFLRMLKPKAKKKPEKINALALKRENSLIKSDIKKKSLTIKRDQIVKSKV